MLGSLQRGMLVVLIGISPYVVEAEYVLSYTGLQESVTVSHTEYYWGTPNNSTTYLGVVTATKYGNKNLVLPGCSAGVELEFFDSPWGYVNPPVSMTGAENEGKWEWNWVGGEGSPADYNFAFHVRGEATASADLFVKPYTSGYGKIVAHGRAKVIVDTATTSSEEDEKDIWVGVQVISSSGGLTGVGVGPMSGSISWSSPVPQDYTPSESYSGYAEVAGTDDDPGSQCFVSISVTGELSADPSNRLDHPHQYMHTMAYASGALNRYHSLHKLQAPTLID